MLKVMPCVFFGLKDLFPTIEVYFVDHFFEVVKKG